MAHLDLLIKELRAEREADRLRLEQLENKVSTLEAEVSTLETEVFTLEAEVSTLHSQNLELGDKVSTLTEENVEQYELIEEQDSKINVLSVNVTELISALKAESNERVNALTKANTQWRAILKAELEENNRQWELKLERQTEFFKAEIAEVRGRLDNLEAQMRAMRTDTDALKDKVDTLANPISVEDRQQINRDLANLVALSYSTVANLQLVDPTYEQRQHWFVLLKEVFKLTKTLPRFGFNVKQHLSFIQLMFKTNPC
jgi:chromosome segregation ATPase